MLRNTHPRSVRLDELLTPDFVSNQHVSDRIIVGPGVLLPFQTTFSECAWASDFASSFWLIGGSLSRVVGAIWVERSSFTRCVFQGVGVAGTEADGKWIEALWS